MHDKDCACFDCVDKGKVSSVCKHRKNEEWCSECLNEALQRCARVVEEQKEKEVAQLFTQSPRKSVTRIDLREYKEQVEIVSYNGVTQYYSYDGPNVIPEHKQDKTMCYLSRWDATTTYTDEGRRQRLATVHMCADHMVVVDWEAQ